MTGIVVGVDGPGHSELALEWAAREAALRRVPLTVITVHQPVVSYWGGGGVVSQPEDRALTERCREALREQADKVLARLSTGAPPQVTIEAICGSAAEELLRAAADADLLVVGSRGAGGFARLAMGSVSAQVAQHARCPVVVIPAPGR